MDVWYVPKAVVGVGAKMEFYHTACGGRIDTKTRTCLRCKRHWNWFSFRFTLTEIRPVPASLTRSKPKLEPWVKPKPTSYAKWGDRLPGVGIVASKLPNWPRWARILVTLILIGIVVGIVLLVVR